jgi:uncharacterized RDD family membrane protein YckC
MEIWLIKDGKKTGPYNDYEIRGRISERQLQPGDYAWHEGLSVWVKLEEIEWFRSEFESLKTTGPPPLPDHFPMDAAQISAPPNCLYLLRRFWARWLDLLVYSALWWLVMYVGGRHIGDVIENRWLMLSMFIPWFVIEAWLLHRFGTTPGKWLLGIRVANDDDTPLTLKSSVWRSLRVMIAGVGFGWGMLSLLCQAMSWFTTRRIGKPVWDFMGKHKVTVVPLNVFKVIALVLLLFTAIQLQSAVRGPYDQERFLKEFPQWEKFFDKSKPLYFPVKH